jgi:2-polyprenyl-3-methyl-5-hydroxy-6-metoxy-1,4-benzoquinol methylase
MSNYAHKDFSYYEFDRSKLVSQNCLVEGRRVLEIGCGTGKTLASLKSQFRAGLCEGVEPHAVQSAPRVEVDAIFQGDFFEYCDDAETKFDLIVLLDVIEHIEDTQEVLDCVKNLLDDGGEVFFSVPNARNFRLLIPLIFFGDFDYRDSGILDETHVRWFTKKSFVKVLKKNGFTVVKTADTGLEQFKYLWWLNLITLGVFRDIFRYQNLFVCKC